MAHPAITSAARHREIMWLLQSPEFFHLRVRFRGVVAPAEMPISPKWGLAGNQRRSDLRILERQTQRKLNQSGLIDLAGDVSRGRVRSCGYALVRKGELDPVEHVEDLCPELQIEPLFIGVIFAREKSKLLMPGPRSDGSVALSLPNV
jgi:hypothetical protein